MLAVSSASAFALARAFSSSSASALDAASAAARYARSMDSPLALSSSADASASEVGTGSSAGQRLSSVSVHSSRARRLAKSNLQLCSSVCSVSGHASRAEVASSVEARCAGSAASMARASSSLKRWTGLWLSADAYMSRRSDCSISTSQSEELDAAFWTPLWRENGPRSSARDSRVGTSLGQPCAWQTRPARERSHTTSSSRLSAYSTWAMPLTTCSLSACSVGGGLAFFPPSAAPSSRCCGTTGSRVGWKRDACDVSGCMDFCAGRGLCRAAHLG